MYRTIYFDMDGVLVDFAEGFKNIAGFSCDGVELNETDGDIVGDWLEQEASRTKFFQNLPPMRGFEQLRGVMKELAMNYDVRILSSCGDYDPYEIRRQKQIWLDNNELGNIQFYWTERTYQKAFFGNRYSILVDDRLEAIRPFEKTGGTGIQYKDNYNLLMDFARKGIEL